MSFWRRQAGRLLFYLIFGLIPLGLWFRGLYDTQFLFSDFYSSINTIAKMAGIAGISFFTGNLFLSGRYKILDRLFVGLDKVFLFHRQTGKLTFYLLTTHFLLMTLGYLQGSFNAFITFILDFSNIPILFGKIAYYCLFVVIIITLFAGRKLKYERLKYIHQYMGVFLFLGGIHAFLIPSDIALNRPMRWYILTLVCLALVSYLTRTVLKKFLVKRKILNVVAVNNLGGNVTEVVMKLKQPAPKILFHPGQFIFVKFKQDGFPYEDHPFSLTAGTGEDGIRISAKAVGDFTKTLPQLKPGATAEVQGPFGSFSYEFINNKKQLWIAGGIGITPFTSMSRTLQHTGFNDKDIILVHTGQTEQDLVYKKEFEEIAVKNTQFSFRPWITEKQGFLTIDEIVKQVGDIKEREIYICGPQKMMLLFTDALVKLGIPKPHIHFELFRLL
jgi:predicted ferric reductase